MTRKGRICKSIKKQSQGAGTAAVPNVRRTRLRSAASPHERRLVRKRVLKVKQPEPRGIEIRRTAAPLRSGLRNRRENTRKGHEYEAARWNGIAEVQRECDRHTFTCHQRRQLRNSARAEKSRSDKQAREAAVVVVSSRGLVHRRALAKRRERRSPTIQRGDTEQAAGFSGETRQLYRA